MHYSIQHLIIEPNGFQPLLHIGPTLSPTIVVSKLYTDQRLAKVTEDHMTPLADLGVTTYLGTVKSAGFMLSLQSFATQPANWRYVCMPSRMRICVKPISRTNSSFVCSLRDGIVFVTLNILLMMS